MEFWLRTYQMYKNGFLPNGQAWLQNTNKLIEIIGFIDIQIAHHNKEVEEKNVRQYNGSNTIVR